jgi:hypothetical protein
MPNPRSATPEARQLAAVTLAACGASGQGATPGQTSSAARAGSFLGRAPDSVIHIEWTSTPSGLAGTLYTDLVRRGGGGKEALNTARSALTWGRVVGNTITLSLASGANVSGTFSGHNLILGYPVDQPGQIGTIVEVPMHAASAGAYDQALAALRNNVASANTAVAGARPGHVHGS